jgi:hypothetical protein
MTLLAQRFLHQKMTFQNQRNLFSINKVSRMSGVGFRMMYSSFEIGIGEKLRLWHREPGRIRITVSTEAVLL